VTDATRHRFFGDIKVPYTPQCDTACGVFFVCAPAINLAFFSTFVPITVFDRH
jgi:hypothetical protein